MSTGPGPGRVDRRWIILAIAVALALAIGGTVYAATLLNSAGGQPVGTPTPAPGSATPSAMPTPTPTPTSTPTVTPTPTPTPTRSQEKTPYCKAFAKITAGGVAAQSEEGSVDFEALSDEFAGLIKKYSAAAELAPAPLQDDYAKVLSYLKQGKSAVDKKNLDQIKVMVKNLGSLNDAMANIQTQSKALCG